MSQVVHERRHRLFLISAAALALLVAALSTAGIRVHGPFRAAATNPPSMDAMRLDMDPDNTPANTATSIGTSEICARINENDILDADEDGTADRINIDLTALNIPAANPMTAFNSQLRYDETEFTLATSNVSLLLNANSGSNIFDASDPVPDNDPPGSYTYNVFNWSVLDIGNGAPESGSGVLARGGLETDPGAVAGLFQIDMANMVHIDPPNNAYFPDNVNWDSDPDYNPSLDGLKPAAFVAVNQECITEIPQKKGDMDCNDSVDAVDALRILRFVAGLSNSLPPGCPPIGLAAAASIAGDTGIKGDMDCNSTVDAVDALRILRYVAGLNPNLPLDCPPIGQ